MVRLTDDQETAVVLAEAWWRDPARGEKPFRLDGYAGTGKTFVVEHVVGRMGINPDNVLAVAPTGKAARVLARRTDWPTSTIHRALYVPLEDPRVTRARARLEAAEDPGEREEARQQLADAERQAELGFSRNGADLSTYELIVVDEHSMVDERVAADLMALQKPLLLLGDPGQLPPVKGRSGFADVRPRVTLTEVMRQDEGSAILHAAAQARRGQPIRAGDYDDSPAFRVVPPKTLGEDDYAGFDVILVGTHKVRRGFNRRMRQVLGFDRDRPLPMADEPLVVRRNDYRLGVTNGQTVTAVRDAEPIDYDTASLSVRDDLDRVLDVTANVLRVRQHVERAEVYGVRGALDVDLAYALTVHSAQGSEWDSVCVVDDWPGNQRREWLYTALTRGSKHVTLVTGRS